MGSTRNLEEKKNATKKKEMPFSGNTKSDTSQHQSTNQDHNKDSTLSFEL